jgi:polyisoprenoid-binding protein YceI
MVSSTVEHSINIHHRRDAMTAPTTTVQTAGYTPGRWVIDPSHTEVGFTVRHLMLAKVRGRFTGVEGEIVLEEDPLASSATATIDLATISTGDEGRDAHLRSTDFFDVETHPTMTYRSTGIRSDGDELVLDGELTLHGVTRSVPLSLEVNGFNAETPFGDSRVGFSATGEIERSDFGITFNMPLPGGDGLTIGDKVKLTLEIEAVRQDA